LSLEISHFWRKDPEWFLEQTQETQQKLIAHYRIRNRTPEEAKRKRVEYNKRITEEEIEKQRACQRKQ